MPFNQLLTASTETLFNQLLRLDPRSGQRLKPLDGKVIALQLRPLPQTFYFIFTAHQVDVLSQYEGDADCRIGVNLVALRQLTDSRQIPAAIKQGVLELEGDLHSAQQFAQLFGELNIDAEEHLSRYTGDIAAHQLMQMLRTLGELITDRLQLMQKELGDYLREEVRLAPGALEVAHFCDQVEQCRDDVAQLEAQIEHLLSISPSAVNQGAQS